MEGRRGKGREMALSEREEGRGGRGRGLHKRHLAVSKPNHSTSQRPSKVADFYESVLAALGGTVAPFGDLDRFNMPRCVITPFAELLISISLFFTPPQ